MLVAVAFYATFLEPDAIEVTRHTMEAPLREPLKIAHLTDLHTRGLGRRERRLLAMLDAERPDLIVITGDTVSDVGTSEMCRALLERLHAPLGVWAVKGNWEHWKPRRNERELYESAGVRLLINAGHAVRGDLWIAVLDDAGTVHPDLEAALSGMPKHAFVLALFHSPAYFDRIAGRCNLALAGHTHGGQVRFPFLGPLWLPNGCGRFVQGWYQQNGSHMYVSRGIGTSLLPVRFLCRPELALIRVGHEPRR